MLCLCLCDPLPDGLVFGLRFRNALLELSVKALEDREVPGGEWHGDAFLLCSNGLL